MDNTRFTLHATQTEHRLSTIIQENEQRTPITQVLDITITVGTGCTTHIIDDLHDRHVTSAKLLIIVQSNASCKLTIRATDKQGTCNVSRDITLQLSGKQANGIIKLLCFGSAQQSFRFKTLQNHLVSDTSSSLDIRSVLDDASTLSAHNVITIVPGAQRSCAEQQSKAILLSRKARATIVPVLEIEANDVKCAHGAAVSRFDNEQMFYLQSRGLDQIEAQKLLIEAFLV